jgi:hypothetical protein
MKKLKYGYFWNKISFSRNKQIDFFKKYAGFRMEMFEWTPLYGEFEIGIFLVRVLTYHLCVFQQSLNLGI